MIETRTRDSSGGRREFNCLRYGAALLLNYLLLVKVNENKIINIDNLDKSHLFQLAVAVFIHISNRYDVIMLVGSDVSIIAY